MQPTQAASGFVHSAAGPAYAEAVALDLRYPGQVWDEESQLAYNLHRYYDAVTGRYVQADPIGLEGGIGFGYVEGNPLSYTDPEGLRSPGMRPQLSRPSTREINRSGGSLPSGPPTVATSGSARDLLNMAGNMPTFLETNLPGAWPGINYIPPLTPIVLPPAGTNSNGCTVIYTPAPPGQCPATPVTRLVCGPVLTSR